MGPPQPRGDLVRDNSRGRVSRPGLIRSVSSTSATPPALRASARRPSSSPAPSWRNSTGEPTRSIASPGGTLAARKAAALGRRDPSRPPPHPLAVPSVRAF